MKFTFTYRPLFTLRFFEKSTFFARMEIGNPKVLAVLDDKEKKLRADLKATKQVVERLTREPWP